MAHAHPMLDNVEKYCGAGQATGDNMAHEHLMLDTQVYKYKLRIYNTYCFSKATDVARTRLNVTLYVHCLSSLLLRRNSPPCA